MGGSQFTTDADGEASCRFAIRPFMAGPPRGVGPYQDGFILREVRHIGSGGRLAEGAFKRRRL